MQQCTSKEWAKYPVKRAKTVSNLKNLFRQVLTQLPCEAMLQHIGTAWAWVLIWSAGSIVVRMMVFVCFCKGATWVTTKRSQPTLRDLKQSLESLLLDTSRFSTGSVSASGSFWKLLDRHVTAGIQYSRAAPKWHLLLGYLMTPRVSFFAYWPTLLYCQSFPKRLQWHVSTLRGYYKDTCSLKHSTSKLRDQLFCSGIWHLHEVSSMIPVHRKHSKQWKRELSGKPCRFFQLQLCWIQ